MATAMAISSLSLLLLLLFPSASSAFSIEFFAKNGSSSAARIAGVYDSPGNGSVFLAGGGEVVYKDPIVFAGKNPGFSTYFAFSLSSRGENSCFAFYVAPAGSPVARERAVFDAAFVVAAEVHGRSSSFVGIDVGGERVARSDEVAVLRSGRKLHCWMEYNGTSNLLRIWIGAAYLRASAKAVVSYPINLSDVLWRRPMMVGFVMNGTSSPNSRLDLYSWALEVRHGPPYRMHSQPLNPDDFLSRPNDRQQLPVVKRKFFSWRVVTGMVFAALCGAMVMFFLLFVWFAVVAHRPVAPVEYPAHPADVVYEKVMLVEVKVAKDEKK